MPSNISVEVKEMLGMHKGKETRSMKCGCVVDVRTGFDGEKYVMGFAKQCGYATRLFSKILSPETDPRDKEATAYALKSHGIND